MMQRWFLGLDHEGGLHTELDWGNIDEGIGIRMTPTAALQIFDQASWEADPVRNRIQQNLKYFPVAIMEQGAMTYKEFSIHQHPGMLPLVYYGALWTGDRFRDAKNCQGIVWMTGPGEKPMSGWISALRDARTGLGTMEIPYSFRNNWEKLTARGFAVTKDSRVLTL